MIYTYLSIKKGIFMTDSRTIPNEWRQHPELINAISNVLLDSYINNLIAQSKGLLNPSFKNYYQQAKIIKQTYPHYTIEMIFTTMASIGSNHQSSHALGRINNKIKNFWLNYLGIHLQKKYWQDLIASAYHLPYLALQECIEQPEWDKILAEFQDKYIALKVS
jgi:hypothetical protein